MIVDMIIHGILTTEDTERDPKSAEMGKVYASVDGIGESHNRLRNDPDSFDAVITAIRT